MSLDHALGLEPPAPASMTALAARLEETAGRARRLGLDRLELRYQADRHLLAGAEQAADSDLERRSEHIGHSGISARAFLGGAIGHAACPSAMLQAALAEPDRRSSADVFGPVIEAAIEAAVADARAQRHEAAMRGLDTEEDPAHGHHDGHREAGTTPEQQLDLVAEAARALLSAAGGEARRARVGLSWHHSERIFASSEGSRISERRSAFGASLSILVEANGVREERSCALGDPGLEANDPSASLSSAQLAELGRALAEEARALARAPLCSASTGTILLMPSVLALQLHASVALPLAADRVLGFERRPGTRSVVRADQLGRLRYGSTLVNLVADARLAGGSGGYTWDDEGVPARRSPLVQRGQLVGLLSSRRLAAQLGLSRSSACLRAASFAAPPILRAPRILLESHPEGPSLEELIADTRTGLLLDGGRSWSLDEGGRNFEVGCEVAWELRSGRRGRLLRRPRYGGEVARFWTACDAVGRSDEARDHLVRDAAPRAPADAVELSHRGPPARFLDVELGAALRA